MIESLQTGNMLKQYPNYKDLLCKPDFLLLQMKKYKIIFVCKKP